jgi:hypothetical protein
MQNIIHCLQYLFHNTASKSAVLIYWLACLRFAIFQSALIAGSCLAFTSAALDIGGNTTRVDNRKEYYPYTTGEKPAL